MNTIIQRRWMLGIAASALLAAAGAMFAYHQTPGVIASANAPAKTADPRLLHEDQEFKIVGVGYGHALSPATPGLYVFGKAHRRWVRLEKVSLEGAVLGRSPTFEECRMQHKNPPSVGWDFRPLAQRTHVDLPLKASGCLVFPDKITRDDKAGLLIFAFNSGWNIPGVETVLRIPLTGLRECLE